jgi:hypothetical protein
VSQQAAFGRGAVADLRSVILLAGRVGPNTFADTVGRSVLDLPVSQSGRTLLDVWLDELGGLAEMLGVPNLRVCVSVDQNGFAPRVRDGVQHPRVEVDIRRDSVEYRGTAGVVRDLTRDYASSDRVLVAAANQFQREPLGDLVRGLGSYDESVSIVPHFGSELAGMFLLRCARLRDVPDVGFVDLKEQAIPSAHGHAPLQIVARPTGAMLPVRTRDEYVHALRVTHLEPEWRPESSLREDPYAETWEPAFRIVEPGAVVAPTAVVQDSVVLAGGRVDEGAALARSVVCVGAVVRRGQCEVEQIVTE